MCCFYGMHTQISSVRCVVVMYKKWTLTSKSLWDQYESSWGVMCQGQGLTSSQEIWVPLVSGSWLGLWRMNIRKSGDKWGERSQWMITESTVLTFWAPHITRPGSQSSNRSLNKPEEVLLLEQWCSGTSWWKKTGHVQIVINTMEKITQGNGMEQDGDRGESGCFRSGHQNIMGLLRRPCLSWDQND